MKCPKCSYTSFDYNQICPKCNKDISSEQQRMNHPAYKPSSAFLIGLLFEERDQSGGPVLDEANNMDMDFEIKENEEARKPEQFVAPAELSETDLLDEGEITDLEPMPGFELEEDVKEISLESDMISPEEPEGPSAVSGTAHEEGSVFLDIDSLSVEGAETEEDAVVEPILEQEEELGIDLEDLSFDEAIPSFQEAEKRNTLNDAERVTLVIDKKKTDQEPSPGLEETELDLDFEELEDK